MLRKALLGTLFFLSATELNASSGVRIGVQGGYKNTRVTHYGDFVPSAALVGAGYSSEKREVLSQKDGFVGGAHVGYDWISANNWYKSLEFSFNAENGKNTKGFILANQPLLKQKTIIISQKINHEYSFSAHLGKAIRPCDLIYLIANLRVARFSESVSDDGFPGIHILKPSIHKHRMGFGFGVGYRHVIRNKHSLGGEATYSVYKKIRIKDDLLVNQLQTADLRVGSKKPHVFRFLLKYSYAFSK